MPTKRETALYCKINFPPEIQNQIPMEMNTQLETKIIQKKSTL